MSVRLHKWKTKTGEREAWICQYSTAEKDDRGKRRRHIKTFATKKQARDFEAQTRVDIGKGVHVPSSKSITVEAAGRNWIDSCGDLERTTLDGYRQHLRDHINPHLGALKLSGLTIGVVRAWQDRLRKDGRSADMEKRVTGSLGALIADAQERSHVATNVVRSLRANRKQKAERRPRGKLKVGTDIPAPEEIEALLEHATGKWRPFLLVAIRCGLRASELRGLRWSDIDFKKGDLHVRQRADAYNTIGRPKSEAGERTVPLPPTTLNALRAWKLASPRGELHYVFPNGSGNVEAHANIITRGLIPTWKRAGVVGRYTGLHCLRHYFASWCLARAPVGLGLSLKETQVRMGHANIALTADVYSHLLPRGDESAALASAEGKFG